MSTSHVNLIKHIHNSTRNKISILGGNYASALKDYIGEENVPVMFGGSDPRGLGESDEENQLKEFVASRLHRSKDSFISGGGYAEERSSVVSEGSGGDISDYEGYETGSDGEGEDSVHSLSCVDSPNVDRQPTLVNPVTGSGLLVGFPSSNSSSNSNNSSSGSNGGNVGKETGMLVGWSRSTSEREGLVAIGALDELMVAIEDLSKSLDAQRKEIELLQAARDKCKLDLFEVVGRKSGLQNQMMSLLCSDEHITMLPAEEGGGGGGGGGSRASVSLTLTMQLKRIRREAERLCEKGNEAQTLLNDAEAAVEAAEVIAEGITEQKRQASRRLSELLAQAVNIGVM
jgi:hypothetical protein